MGLLDTAYEGPGWQIPSKPPEFTTGLTALQCEPKADWSRSYTCTNDNDNDNRNMILLYHPLRKIKTWTSCLDLDNAHRERWARLEARLSRGWAGCRAWGHIRFQAVCPEEAFSAVLGVMKKYGCELNTPRNDEITLFVFTFVLMNQFHLFLVFCWYEWVIRCACVKNALGGILK